MLFRKIHLTHLAIGAALFATLTDTARAAMRRPIEDFDPVLEPVVVQPRAIERIVVEPEVDAFPESGVQHPAALVALPPLVPSGGTYDSQKNIERSFGNDNWGGGYRLYSHVRALSPGYQSINFDTSAWGKLFGKRIEAFRVVSATWNPRDDYRSSRMQAYLAGAQLVDEFQESHVRISSTLAAFNRAPLEKSILSTQRTFTVGPVPITVKGSIGTRFGASATARAYRSTETTSGVSLVGNATVEAYAKLSAAVGVTGFSAGVRGSVDLVEIKPVMDMRVDRSGGSARYNNDFWVEIASLDGYVEVFAEALWKEWSKVILDWEGYRFTYTVSDESGTVYFTPLHFVGVPLAELTLAQPLGG